MRRVFSILFGLALVLGFSLVATAPVAAATPVYVDAARPDDSGAGTSWATAKKYIQSGINIVDTGGTVYVAAGTYLENLASWKDMEITKSLSLIGAGSGQTVVNLTEGKMNGVEIRGSGLSVTIQGITFTKRSGATYSSNFGLRIAETASTFVSLVLRDVEVAFANASDVFLGSAGTFSQVAIENCYFHHGGTWGFLSSGTVSGMTVIDSRFEYNGQVDPGHGNGFDLTGTSSNVLVDGGSFSNNKQSGINLMRVSNAIFRNFVANDNAGAGGGGFGLKLDEWGSKSQNITVENFTADGNGLDGVVISPEKPDAIEDVFIRYATLSNNVRDGLGLWYINNGSNNPQMKDVSITHSNIVGNGQYGVQVGAWWVPMTITEVFAATCNWWGDSSGPRGGVNDPITGTPANGSGDRVSANVAFDGWLGKPGSTATTTGTGTASFAASVGCMASIISVPTPPGAPVALPHGMFSFNVSCIEPGATVVLNVTLPSAAPIGTKWWKYQNGAWYSMNIGDDDGDNFITVNFKDGGQGDADGTANRLVMDDGGPGAGGAVGWKTYPVSKVRVMLPWIVLGLALAGTIGWYILRRRRVQS